MSEYTPDTGAVRSAYTRAMRQAFIASTGEHIEEFDRWLAEHDRQVAAAAWDEGAIDGEWNFEHEAMIERGNRKRIENPYRKETA